MRIFETFAPVSLFFHVRDKYQPAFIGHDQGVSTDASYVYILIFTTCGEKDHCWLSQTTMALLSKSSVRTIQNHLNELVKTEYISIRKDEHGRNIYTLLLSPRLIALLRKLGIPTHDPRITAEEPHENFSHDIRVNKKQDITPLPPFRAQRRFPLSNPPAVLDSPRQLQLPRGYKGGGIFPLCLERMRHHTHPAYYTAQPSHMSSSNCGPHGPKPRPGPCPTTGSLPCASIAGWSARGSCPPSKYCSLQSSSISVPIAVGSTATLLSSLAGCTRASSKRLRSCAPKRQLSGNSCLRNRSSPLKKDDKPKSTVPVSRNCKSGSISLPFRPLPLPRKTRTR